MMLLIILSSIALAGYALIDLAQPSVVRARWMPKDLWALTVLALPVVGPLLWLGLGRPRTVSLALPVGEGVAPDDDPRFIELLRRRIAVQRRLAAQGEQEIQAFEGREPEQYA